VVYTDTNSVSFMVHYDSYNVVFNYEYLNRIHIREELEI